MNMFWYVFAKEFFSDKSFVSTGLLQRYLQIDYYLARSILDQMIEGGFCQPQMGSFPCEVIRLDN